MLDTIAKPVCAQLPLNIKGLCYDIAGQRLLSDIDLNIKNAGITVIMGANGAGKSLLVRLMHGLLKPSAGSVQWAETPCGPDTTSHQAMVFQKPVLLRRSVAANIDFVLRLKSAPDTARRDQLLTDAALSNHHDKPARALSGGEQQRLALARALASDPDVLFLDEPTANLDPASTQLIENTIRKTSARGVKIVLVTHNADQARRLADDVVFLHKGTVAEYTRAAQFFKKPSTQSASDYLAGKLVV